jgi:heat shock protein HtpX
MITVMVCDILFGILASIIVAWFSRQREFRADAGAAGLMGSPRPMIAALQRLGGHGSRAAAEEHSRVPALPAAAA